MILRHDDVEPALADLHEHGIARLRAASVDFFASRRIDRRLDDANYPPSAWQDTTIVPRR